MYCYNLNLDIKPLKFDLELKDVPYGHDYYSVSDANPELVDFLAQRNVRIGRIVMFNKDPGIYSDLQIHIDEGGGDFVKLNWVWGGADSYMCWYKDKNPIKRTMQYTKDNTTYTQCIADEVEMIYKENLQGPCIVQVGIPHNVIMGKEHRHALSMLLVDTGTNSHSRLSYDRSLIAFSDCIRK